MNQLPQGPKGDQFPAFFDDPFGFLLRLQEYGSVVGIELEGITTAVVYDLDAIKVILADKLEHVGMAAVFERLSHATGSGILTNYDWETWHPRRRRIFRPLGVRMVTQFQERMVGIIEQHLQSWPVGESFDLNEALRNVTLPVVADLLFTTDLQSGAIDLIDRVVDEIHKWAEADPSNADLAHEPESFRSAVDAFDAYVAEVISRRDPDDPGDDLLGVLLSAAAEPEPPIDAVGVRDELVTLILAGHETVTAATSFALDLVGRHPKKRAENPRHIVDEALRLYPPVHMTTRAIVKDFNVGAVTLPAGCEVLIPEYVLYRDARYFERPDEFLPERWADDSTLHMEPRAYFPFLSGPKFCVGSHFALMEATEIVGRFLQRFDHEMLDPIPPSGRDFALTFAPDRPMPVLLKRRQQP